MITTMLDGKVFVNADELRQELEDYMEEMNGLYGEHPENDSIKYVIGRLKVLTKEARYEAKRIVSRKVK